MLSSAKIGRSSWRYYSRTVAGGACEYYAEHGDAPGRWHGAGLDRLGLTPGAVAAERELEAFFGRALSPTTGVAVNEIGEPVHPDTYSADFQRLAANAGLRRIRLHDCRHSAISLLLAAGVPVVAVAGVMGHDPVVTQRIYAHMFEDDAVDAMATLDKVLRRV